MSKIKVAVVGACISRDPFKSTYVHDYKTWYEVVNTTFQTSIVSLMTKDVQLTEEEMKDTCKKDAHRQHLKGEMSKTYMKELLNSSPDYIIVDLYSDIRYGIMKLKDTYLTNAPTKIRQTEFYKQKKYDEIILYHKDKKRYMSLIDKYFTEFIEQIRAELPNVKIILAKVNYAHSYIDDENIIRNIDIEKYNYIDRDNKHWNELTEYLQEKYDLEVLDMTKREYFADPNYPFGFAPWHYEKQFYQDFIKELNGICLKDILEAR